MLKVVIADDEARILSLIRLLPDWDALGIEVAGTAGNGLEALALIERERPDILITDIRMPGCQGLELIEKDRSRYRNHHYQRLRALRVRADRDQAGRRRLSAQAHQKGRADCHPFQAGSTLLRKASQRSRYGA